MAEGAARPACLIIRPEAAAAASAGRVEALGWAAVPLPTLVLAPLPIDPAPAAQAALLPSPASVPALAAAWPRDRPVLAVGEGTAAAARAAGFVRVAAAGGDARSLAALAARRLDPAAGPLLLAAGQGYGDELSEDLTARGFSLARRDAYLARDVAALPAEALAALASGRVRAALFLSPRGAAGAVRLLREAGLEGEASRIRAVALSARVAHALAGPPWRGLDVAARPDHDALLDLLGPAPPREGWTTS